MSEEQFTNLRLLQLRNAIATKESCIAAANRETAHFENWQSDWAKEFQLCEEEIQGLVAQLHNR